MAIVSVVPLCVLSSSHNTCVLFLEFFGASSNNSDIFLVKSRGWTQSMQDAIPHRGFYLIKLHDLKGSSSAIPRG
jgi:hypothetical protein